jgi:hypothetical protein
MSMSHEDYAALEARVSMLAREHGLHLTRYTKSIYCLQDRRGRRQLLIDPRQTLVGSTGPETKSDIGYLDEWERYLMRGCRVLNAPDPRPQLAVVT